MSYGAVKHVAGVLLQENTNSRTSPWECSEAYKLRHTTNRIMSAQWQSLKCYVLCVWKARLWRMKAEVTMAETARNFAEQLRLLYTDCTPHEVQQLVRFGAFKMKRKAFSDTAFNFDLLLVCFIVIEAFT